MDENLIVARCLEEFANILDGIDWEYDWVWNGEDEVSQLSVERAKIQLSYRLRERARHIGESDSG